MALSLGMLAVRHGCELRGDPDLIVERVDTLARADGQALAFFANPAYRRQLRVTHAAAVVIAPADSADCPVAALISRNPYVTYAHIAADLHPAPPPRPGIHATAVIGADCTVPPSCAIAAYAVVGDGVVLGERVSIGAHCALGEGVAVGADSRLYAGVVLYDGVRVGRRCIIHSAAVLGADGFGFARDPDARHVKVPQIGRVWIGDDVEIGAGTTVDCGAIEDTRIGDGTKIDNGVQIGHNVVIGEHTIIAGHSGVSGSTRIGARCVIGGMVAIAGHLDICDDVMLAGGTPVTGSIRQPGIYGGGGLPADDIRRWRRNIIRAGHLEDLVRRLGALEKRLGPQAAKDADP